MILNTGKTYFWTKLRIKMVKVTPWQRRQLAVVNNGAGRPASLVELGAGAGTAGGGVVVKYPSAHTDGPSERFRSQEQI